MKPSGSCAGLLFTQDNQRCPTRNIYVEDYVDVKHSPSRSCEMFYLVAVGYYRIGNYMFRRLRARGSHHSSSCCICGMNAAESTFTEEEDVSNYFKKEDGEAVGVDTGVLELKEMEDIEEGVHQACTVHKALAE
ncbi:hypothetical protein MKW98_011435 [Papaver atlanticum]|uniref:Uncharacterized protein n=1 Tax=Papaver atlanticum TaxID=357466 RepID=A0AAD4XFW0_9MAGN|nr:hypothetical protein MKW98_011435 [Papaver atlanticum]